MNKRSALSSDVCNFRDIYRKMSKEQLQDEFDAVSDQLVAMLEIFNCSSIEVLYDVSDVLFIEFKENAIPIENNWAN